jgi:hypothetical protein
LYIKLNLRTFGYEEIFCSEGQSSDFWLGRYPAPAEDEIVIPI